MGLHEHGGMRRPQNSTDGGPWLPGAERMLCFFMDAPQSDRFGHYRCLDANRLSIRQWNNIVSADLVEFVRIGRPVMAAATSSKLMQRPQFARDETIPGFAKRNETLTFERRSIEFAQRPPCWLIRGPQQT